MDGEHEEAATALEQVKGSHASLAQSYLRLLKETSGPRLMLKHRLYGQSVILILRFNLCLGRCNMYQHLLWMVSLVSMLSCGLPEQYLWGNLRLPMTCCRFKAFNLIRRIGRWIQFKAMSTCVKGNVSEGKEMFAALEGKAPPQGIA